MQTVFSTSETLLLKITSATNVPGVSVIIPTYNGEKKLPGLLDALKKQTFKDFDVVIVIDGSTDKSEEIIEQHANGLQYKIINQANSGRSVVRNRGVRECGGELLVFFDDDMRPEPSCIEVHSKHHLGFPGSILTGAQLEQEKADSSDFFRFKAFLSNKWKKSVDTNKPLKKNQVFITAANFSVSKKTFEQLGGFDERLKDAEDFDLAVRAFKAGVPLYINYEALAWHDDFVNCISYIRRQRQYSDAHKKLIALKSWIAEEGFIKPVLKPKGWREKLFKVFSSRQWIQAVDQDRLYWLPRSLRYKLYDIIITANGVFFPEKVQL